MPHKFTVLGVPVYTRTLPSGDMTVWHPFNDAVRSIIEPICRLRGYWQPDYHNWVIKSSCRAAVLAELAAIGDAS